MLRAERGISRRQLADALGRALPDRRATSSAASYGPSLHLALRIAQYFEVPVEVIFSVEPFPRLGDEAAVRERT